METEQNAYKNAVLAGARHLAVLHLVRHRLLTGHVDNKTFPSPKPLRVVHWRQESRLLESPIAFLASFTREEWIDVFPLKSGVNRVGRNLMFSDYEQPQGALPAVEGRQWLIFCRPGLAMIADDHSTNQSFIVPIESIADPVVADPRISATTYFYANAREAWWTVRVDLDWAGDTLHELTQGDAVIAVYAAFVFGWVPMGVRWPLGA